MTKMMDTADMLTLGYDPVNDMCDACGAARAKFVAFIANGLLLFCRHCNGIHEPSLVSEGLETIEFNAN